MNRIVYSTDADSFCPRCGQPKAACRCRAQQPAGDGIVRVSRETKGRKGKGVTIIRGVPLNADELPALAKQLKQLCGSGGSINDCAIEIQGDHRDRLIPALQKHGWVVKKAGG